MKEELFIEKGKKKKYKLHIIVLKVKKEKSSMEHNREPNHKFYAAILHFDVWDLTAAWII